MHKCCTVIYHGRVQGVGFRWTARSTAADFAVVGYVRNLPDGTVELLAEGEEREVKAFLAALRQNMRSFIRQADVRFGPPTQAFASFEIRH